MNYISLIKQAYMSPTAQGAFRPIPDLISCTQGVTGDCCLIHGMQSDCRPYSKVGRDSLIETTISSCSCSLCSCLSRSYIANIGCHMFRCVKSNLNKAKGKQCVFNSCVCINVPTAKTTWLKWLKVTAVSGFIEQNQNTIIIDPSIPSQPPHYPLKFKELAQTLVC